MLPVGLTLICRAAPVRAADFSYRHNVIVERIVAEKTGTSAPGAAYASAVVVGLYAGGAIAHDARAKEVALVTLAQTCSPPQSLMCEQSMGAA